MRLGTHGGFWEFYCEKHPTAYVAASPSTECKIRKRASAKGRKLNRARAILKAATPAGFTLIESSINPGGVAVAGEAYAVYAVSAHEPERKDRSGQAVYVCAMLSGDGRGYVRRETKPGGNFHHCMGQNLSIEGWNIRKLILEASRQIDGCHGAGGFA